MKKNKNLDRGCKAVSSEGGILMLYPVYYDFEDETYHKPADRFINRIDMVALDKTFTESAHIKTGDLSHDVVSNEEPFMKETRCVKCMKPFQKTPFLKAMWNAPGPLPAFVKN